jgi:hypothetical protein
VSSAAWFKGSGFGWLVTCCLKVCSCFRIASFICSLSMAFWKGFFASLLVCLFLSCCIIWEYIWRWVILLVVFKRDHLCMSCTHMVHEICMARSLNFSDQVRTFYRDIFLDYGCFEFCFQVLEWIQTQPPGGSKEQNTTVSLLDYKSISLSLSL